MSRLLVCDRCDARMEEVPHVRRIKITDNNVIRRFDDPPIDADFCSWRCVVEYATERQLLRTQRIEAAP